MLSEEKTEYIELPNAIVEVGDLAHEVGKRYLDKLWKVVEAHADLGLEKLYIWARIEKNIAEKTKTKFKMFGLLKPLEKLRQSSALYEYDFKKEQMLLLWTIPHRSEFRNILTYPERNTPEYVDTIKRYIKQEGLKINMKPIIIPLK
jgi:hypothetical protein